MVETTRKVLVLGRGFLGKAFEQAGFEVWGKDRFVLQSGGDLLPLTHLRPYDTIINCVGKSNTRWCERKENFRAALWSNGEVPRILSGYCKGYGKQFVHISTGCLYDEEEWEQDEDDLLCARCRYTLTKWVGEMGCGEGDLVLRPRLYFGAAKDRNNLLCKLPRFTKFLGERNSYSSVEVIVAATKALLKAEQGGVFNVACQGTATVWELAGWIGLHGDEISGRQLRDAEGLYLVNNTMDLSKLMRFYTPPMLKGEVMRCWEAMK